MSYFRVRGWWSIGNEIHYLGDPFGHPRGHNGLKPGMLDVNVLLSPLGVRLRW